jgi:glutamate synthase domain-containing protein 2/glutamate synthase domain-containing protein 1/glutamate synthase domain-containing protein 3
MSRIRKFYFGYQRRSVITSLMTRPTPETRLQSIDAFAHDACGVGFIARPDGRAGRRVVTVGLQALRRLAHRGAPAALGAVDGCGVLTAIPWALLESAARPLPAGRSRAVAMLFVDPADATRAVSVVEREMRGCGALEIRWRTVPTNGRVVLPAQQETTPLVLQAIAAFDDGRVRSELTAYRCRLRIEQAAAADGVGVRVASLSTRTIVYKGLVTPETLDRFYPDLASEAFASPFITFHQRYSTNTSADWALAQPFRTLAHNGEINTIAGNRAWMRARLADATSLPGFEGLAPIAFDGSDSRTLDDAVELLRHRGFSLAHAVSRLVPPAWERDRDLPPDVRAFYEFQSLVAEPWDGPSALVFADGRYVGAALDRNGFRPARYVSTADGLVALASEVGILPATDHEIVDRRRLGPGDMVIVDLDRHHVWGTQDVRRRLAFRRRYRQMVSAAVMGLPVGSCGSGSSCGAGGSSNPMNPMNPLNPLNLINRVNLVNRQAAFGCTREEIELLLKPMIADAHEAVGSMGDDTPPAVLSSRSRLLTDYFRQRFAQVTNPPVDPYRESDVMSLTTMLGAHGSFLEEIAPPASRISLRSPILSRDQFAQLAAADALSPSRIESTFDAAGGAEAFESRLAAIGAEACAAVRNGSALVMLTDCAVDATRAPLPAVLAVSAVHRALVDAGLRMRASIVIETGDGRDAHQLAALFAFGAAAACPALGLETIEAIGGNDDTGCRRPVARYRLALERGLLTIMSKMGVCTFASYCGAQLFEIIGLDRALVDRLFPGIASPLGGVTLTDIATTVLARHRQAFACAAPVLAYPGLHGYRRDGEYHATNPLVVKTLQKSRNAANEPDSPQPIGEGGPHAYDTFKSHVYGRPPAAVRDLLEFVPRAPIALDEVESEDAICRRFFASAMSVGALSPEAHRMIAVAMNRIGARSNSGEGGEEPDRFARPIRGDWSGSRTKQVASARFGVTPAYLRSADELQIKIAQGSKPGEGGQLPAMKVVPHIAKLRHTQPGTTLISPPVHHDIYSIEDLAQLIFDLRTFHPAARMNVKLVASTGIGVIATGVAKAGADAIQVSGHDGGTGASPRASIKHAGMPWEIGLAEAHQALMRAGLRDRVVLQTDGGLKTGRDIAIAAALGADEYGFGTAALVAIGCVMARQCHMNTCPVGIATQREDLRAEFNATPEMLIGYLRLIAAEVREILASIGLRTIDELIGRTDLLMQRADVKTPLDLGMLLGGSTGPALHVTRRSGPSGPAATFPAPPVLARARTFPFSQAGTIANTDRAFGAGIAGEIASRFGDAGVAEGSVQLSMTGSAGQSFGAFTLPGMRLTLVGDANDGLGKGMHGGDIIVSPAARERGRARQVLVGNAALYGATGGRVFVAGHVGERFAVRNSGATAVIEGAGDHCCEYMTGGTVLVLGPVGRNFAAGMTGGIAFVSDRQRTLATRTHGDQTTVQPLTLAQQRFVHELIETHERLTGSRVARAILRNDPALSTFVSVRHHQSAVDGRQATVEKPEERAVNE